MIKLLLLLFLSTSLFCQDMNSFMPVSFGAWNKSGEAEVYKGNELYRLIDGGADIFFEYGFICVTRQSYSDKDDNLIDIEIYEMADSAASYGIFSLFTFETGEPVDELAEAYSGDEFLLFRKGKYYISLTSLSNTGAFNDDMLTAAGIISNRILYEDVPGIVKYFSKYTRERLVYIEGNLGLYNLSLVNFGSNLNIESCICFKDSNNLNFVFYYAEPNECRKNYTAALNFMDSSKSFARVTNVPGVMYSGSGNNIAISSSNNFLIISAAGDPVILSSKMKELEVFVPGFVNKRPMTY